MDDVITAAEVDRLRPDHEQWRPVLFDAAA